MERPATGCLQPLWADTCLLPQEGLDRAEPVEGPEGEKYAFDKPKTKGSERLVTLPTFAIVALRAHRARQAEERLKVKDWTDLDLVFPNRYGRPMAENNLVKRHYRPLLEAAGCPSIRFHDLRHSCATVLLTRGVHPKKVQELLGHSQISVTMDRYSHLLPGMHDEAAATMDALFGKQ